MSEGFTLKINVRKIVPVKHNFAVFFTDSAGKRALSADIWGREKATSEGVKSVWDVLT